MATDVPFCRRGKIDRIIPCFSANLLAICNPKPEPSTDLFDLSRSLTERVFTQSNSSGVKQGAHEAPGYGILSSLITAGCHAAIKITEKI